MATYTVSKDGKTISVSGKTYSLAAFKNQFKTEPGVPLNAGAKGYAAPKAGAKAPIKINTNPKPGSTVIGPLAKGASSGIAGLALGAIAAYKAEIKATSKAKQMKNRMN